MAETALDTPFLTEGIAHVAFWNGRVLTAEDLRDEQQANLLSRRRLGRAVGSGIASGLVVGRAGIPTQVEVGAGIALDRYGQALELPVDVTVSLVVPTQPIVGEGVFVVCNDLPSARPSGTGLYLLVLRPAEDEQSSAPGITPFGNGTAGECGPRYTVDGVAFRLLALDADGLAADAGHDAEDVATISTAGSAVESALLRNVLAHLLLDTRRWHTVLRNPFLVDSQADIGAVGSLRTSGLLEPCEVPLALLSWSSGGVNLIDRWSVRRPVAFSVATVPTEHLADPALGVLARASYSQFQDHLDALHRTMNPLQRFGFQVRSAMRYLPAAGLVPTSPGPGAGFSETNFFAGLVTRGPVPISGDEVTGILGRSLDHRPIDLRSGEVIFLYSVLAEAGDGVEYLVFTTSRMEFMGDELAIDAIFPAGPVSPGQLIEIRGRGFRFTQGLTRLRFDELTTVPQPDSTDTRLAVIVPTTLVVPSAGMEVTVEVSNGTDTDSVPLTVVRPTVPVLGDLHVEWLRTEPTILGRGGRGELVYNVRSGLNQSAAVSLLLETSDTVSGVSGFGPVPGNEGTDDAPIIRMEPDGVVEIRVVVDPIPAVDDFNVSVGAMADTIVGEDTRTFETETEITPPDPTITLLINGMDVQSGTGSLSGTRVTLNPGSIGNVDITATLTEPVDYLVRAEPSTVSGPWGSVIFQPADGDLDGGGAARSIVLSVVNNSATASGSVAVIVNRPGRSDEARITFTLVPGANP